MSTIGSDDVRGGVFTTSSHLWVRIAPGADDTIGGVSEDESEPLYRAALIQSSLAHLRQHEDAVALEAELGTDIVSAIESAAPRDLIPYAHHLRMLELLWDRGGKHAVRDLAAHNVSDSLNSPIFNVLRVGFVKTFGLSPATTLNGLPRGVRKSGRNLGRIDIDVDAESRRAKTIWHRLHPSMRVPWVAWSHTSTYDVLLTWAGARDVGVQVNLTRLEQGEAHFEIDWVE